MAQLDSALDIVEPKMRKHLEDTFKMKGEKKGSDPWVEICFSLQGICYIKVTMTRSIIVSFFHPPDGPKALPRSQGEKALSLAIILAEVQDINLSGYERTYAPPWVLPNEAKLKGADLSRDGIVYVGAGAGEPPKPLSLGANIDGMIAFGEHYLDKYKKCFFLDAFELLQQTHMTKGEVSARQADDFRQLGLYVLSDEKTNLVPTTMCLNEKIHNKIKNEDKLSKVPLTARYVSPLAYSHKNSLYARLGAVIQAIMGVVALKEKAPRLKHLFNYEAQIEQIILTGGFKDLLNTDDRKTQLYKIMLAEEKAATDNQLETNRALALQNEQSERDALGQEQKDNNVR